MLRGPVYLNDGVVPTDMREKLEETWYEWREQRLYDGADGGAVPTLQQPGSCRHFYDAFTSPRFSTQEQAKGWKLRYKPRRVLVLCRVVTTPVEMVPRGTDDQARM